MEKETKELDIWELAKVIWSHRRKLIKWGALGLIMGCVVAFSIPKQFESQTTLISEAKGKSSSLGQMGVLAGMAGVNIGSSTAEGISDEIYPDIIKSTPFLIELASIPVTYNGEQMTLEEYILNHRKREWWISVISAPSAFVGWIFSGKDRAESDTLNVYNDERVRQYFVHLLGEMISIEKDKKSSLLKIKTIMQSRPIAHQLTDSVASKIEEYIIAYRTNKAHRNLENSIHLLLGARDSYDKANKLYAEALDQNQNLISQVAKTKISRLKDEQQLSFSIYQQLAMQVETDRIKLQEDTPIMTVVEPTITSLDAVAPKKKRIVILWVFLAIFGAAGVVVVKEVINQNE